MPPSRAIVWQSLAFMLLKYAVRMGLGTFLITERTVSLNSSKVLHPFSSTFVFTQPQKFSIGLN